VKGNRMFKWTPPTTCSPDYVPDWWFDVEEIVSREGDVVSVELEVAVFGEEIANDKPTPLLMKIRMSRKLGALGVANPLLPAPKPNFQPLKDGWEWGVTLYRPATALIYIRSGDHFEVTMRWTVDSHGDIKVCFEGPGVLGITFRK